MPKPVLCEVHLLINSTCWEKAYAKIILLLKNNRLCEKFSLIPLYVNFDIEDTELRICAQIKNPGKLGEFIAEKICKVKGVESARVRLTLEGRIFPEGVGEFIFDKKELLSCHVFINSCADKNDLLWQSLSRLKKEGEVFPVWVFRDFYEYSRDITLRVIGKEEKEIRRYIEKKLKVMPGIRTWQLRFTHSSVRILSKRKLFKLSGNWFIKPVDLKTKT